MLKWIKVLFGGKAGMIKLLDELEAPLADEGREIQKQISQKDPGQVSKYLIDKFQLQLCKIMKVDPKDVGLLLLIGLTLSLCPVMAHAMADPAPQDTDIYFEAGPLKLTIPFKSMDMVYLYDGLNQRSLVGGETTMLILWERVSATAGAITSLQGAGTPFVGLDIALGNALDRFVNLGPIRIGGFGGRDFRAGVYTAGIKTSVQLW